MTIRERIGLAGLIVLLALLAGMAVYSCRHPSHAFENSPIIKQRIINVEKSK